MPRHTKQKPEEKRIYVIVPKTVDVPNKRGDKRGTHRVHMDSRWAAQGAHAVLEMADYTIRDGHSIQGWGSYVLIYLSVRNSRELGKVRDELIDHPLSNAEFEVYDFFDQQPDFYGTKDKIMTAVCVTPIERSKIESVIGHLEKYED